MARIAKGATRRGGPIWPPGAARGAADGVAQDRVARTQHVARVVNAVTEVDGERRIVDTLGVPLRVDWERLQHV